MVPMIDPLRPAKQLFAWVDREIRIARRVVFFTCTCGIFPTSSRSVFERWGLGRGGQSGKAIERRTGPSLLLAANEFVALSHTRPIGLIQCDYLD
jgi:hypothetical protein